MYPKLGCQFLLVWDFGSNPLWLLLPIPAATRVTWTSLRLRNIGPPWKDRTPILPRLTSVWTWWGLTRWWLFLLIIATASAGVIQWLFIVILPLLAQFSSTIFKFHRLCVVVDGSLAEREEGYVHRHATALTAVMREIFKLWINHTIYLAFCLYN